MTILMFIVSCIGGDSENRGFKFSSWVIKYILTIFHHLHLYLFNCSMCYNPHFSIFLTFVFFCLFVFYSDTPTSLSSSGPGKFTVETEQALFWPTGVILTFCSLSSFSHIFLLLLVLCPVLRCDKTFFQAILDSEDHRWHFVNRHFGNFFFSPILIFNCDEQFFL